MPCLVGPCSKYEAVVYEMSSTGTDLIFPGCDQKVWLSLPLLSARFPAPEISVKAVCLQHSVKR